MFLSYQTQSQNTLCCSWTLGMLLGIQSFEVLDENICFSRKTYLLNVYYCRLISDLVVVIVSATCGGIAFACLGQPVSTCTFISSSFCIIINSWKHNLSVQNVVFLKLSYVNLQFKVYCR